MLVRESLESDLLDLFKSPPSGAIEAASAWSNAITSYAKNITPIVPPPIADAAGAVLQGSLAAAFTSGFAATLPAMDAAFTVFAASLGVGMAPAFAATPPPTPIGFSTLFAPIPTYEAAAVVWSNKIHTWFLTGTAVQSSSGLTVPWT